MTRKTALHKAIEQLKGIKGNKEIIEKLQDLADELPITHWTDKSIRDRVEQFAEENGRNPTASDFRKKGMPPHPVIKQKYKINLAEWLEENYPTYHPSADELKQRYIEEFINEDRIDILVQVTKPVSGIEGIRQRTGCKAIVACHGEPFWPRHAIAYRRQKGFFRKLMWHLYNKRRFQDGKLAMEMAKKSNEDGKKRCLIVKGGPGTGKTVLAINLLADLTNKPYEMVCHYVTKNAAPRNVYATKLSGDFRKTRINNLFKGSGSFIDVPNNYFDCLIADEAHRLNAKSGMFKNQGENQIKEIINAAKFSVFFIDETQRIDIYDIGSIAEIEKYLDEFNVVGEERKILELESQFRCNGSDGYLSWLDNLLEIRKGVF